VPDAVIDRVFAVMALSPQHTFQLLTKRPERMRDYCRAAYSGARFITGAAVDIGRHSREVAAALWPNGGHMQPLPNVWLGVSVEDQAAADARIPLLLATPAAKRFLSCEPLLGPVDLTKVCMGESAMEAVPGGGLDGCTKIRFNINALAGVQSFKWQGLDWIIAGGESGRGARPMHPDWARDLRDQCAAAGVPFLFKQWGEFLPVFDRDADDPDWQDCGRWRETHPRGQWLNIAGGQGFHGKRVIYTARLGKHLAGRMLDGTIHDGFPA
jgi:protein gp37